ncbi:hypothetical protein O5O45_00500 [Hahella aquimaris]|uniref:hypothetical protein n=1 Tax=Hahella sp. HNIBRBA332 TaxID=3015983 RepID=UPI00273A9A2D|nr:hypothetical protein [Hahella sp. HNIBRBA332]WLQ14414.1 hypothetical protein O5O45_00500 [Hahella sp. HNIBRBA332]
MAYRKKNSSDALESLAESQQLLEFLQFAMVDRPNLQLSQESQLGYNLVVEHIRERLEVVEETMKTESE